MLLATIALGIALMIAPVHAAERQVTDDPTTDFALDDNHNFSPDGRWLAYDTRVGPLQNTPTIEKVNVATGERVVLYRAPDMIRDFGPGLGAASYLPGRDEVIFIHGPFTRSGLKYDMTRRTGAISPGDGSGRITWADARDVTAPYTPGALRGGTHRHDPGGPGGRWVGYTYNDAIMKARAAETGRDLDLRTLGVTRLDTPVRVTPDTGEGRSGAGFSVVIVKVAPKEELDANPGDGLFQAAYDQWVGTRGYRKADGTWQIARAFIGALRRDGRDHREIYIVDIPDDITKPGPDGPLEGTATAFPAPPAGTIQRRLTHTASGCYGYPRTPSDGSRITFLSPDENRVPQVFSVSPAGGAMTQITRFPTGAQESALWMPDDRHILTVTGNAVTVVNVATGASRTLTDPEKGRPNGLAVSPDGKLVAFNREVAYESRKAKQIFVADIVLP